MNQVNMDEIEKAVVHLLTNKGVFYASLLSQMKRIVDEKMEFTAGVTIRNGYMELYWNPKEFAELSNIQQKVAVLEHECHHLVKNHIARKGDRDHKLWNIATDLTINQTIDDLPDWVVDIDKPAFKSMGMVRNKPAEQYYNILKKNAKHIQFSKGANGRMKATIKNGDGSGSQEFELDSPNGHDKWDDGKADSPDIQEEVVRQSVKKAVEQVERSQGRVPGDLIEDIKLLDKPAIIPWQRILRRWIGMKVKAGHKYSWKRPNRRYGMTQKGKIPLRKLIVTVAIDTSGSISDEDLQAFMIEINGIMSSYKSVFWIIECDYSVQKAYKLTLQTKVDPKFKGRGGTSFVPVFDYIEKHHLDPDLLIYFTDLYGDFPNKPPKYPVLWVSVSRDIQAPWGDILILDRNTPKEDYLLDSEGKK